jgi:UDP-3-O-acyl N-acetylglucosamine deacetylase
MFPRRTIQSEARLRGAGLFSGRAASLCFLGASSGDGVTFLRTDLAGSRPIPATIDFLSADSVHAAMPAGLRGRNTAVADTRSVTPSSVATIEHVMSALAGLGITDVRIEIDGPEVPILDGSALPFVEALDAAGVVELAAPLDPLRIELPVEVVDEKSGARIIAMPCWDPLPTFTYELDYGVGAPLPAQSATWSAAIGSRESVREYVEAVAPARTFSLEHEARAMQAMGLFKHLSPRDMLVYDAAGRPIDNAARLEDEPARHKLLDLIGDLYLLGRPLHADVTATKSGHGMTHELVRRLRRAME